MKAIILVAGTGSRLRPLTDDQPKCMVALKGKPLIEYQLDAMRACGIDDIVLVTGYKREALARYKLRSYKNERFESTNMVYSLFCAEAEFDDDIVICYGDIVFEPRVLRSLVDSDSEFAVVVDKGWHTLWELRMEDPISDAESLKMNAQGEITEIGKKVNAVEVIEGQYIGLIKFSAQCISRVSTLYHSLDRKARYDGRSFEQMFMTSLIQTLIDSGFAAKAVCIDHGWLEVDTLSDLDAYESLEPEAKIFKFPAVSTS